MKHTVLSCDRCGTQAVHAIIKEVHLDGKNPDLCESCTIALHRVLMDFFAPKDLPTTEPVIPPENAAQHPNTPLLLGQPEMVFPAVHVPNRPRWEPEKTHWDNEEKKLRDATNP